MLIIPIIQEKIMNIHQPPIHHRYRLLIKPSQPIINKIVNQTQVLQVTSKASLYLVGTF